MMLAERDLLRAWKNKWIRFEPDISQDQIGLSSIDLRLGCIFTKQKAVVIRPAHDFDPSDQIENFTLGSGQTLSVKPRQFLLAQTLEKVFVPSRYAAHVNGKSSLARAGLAVHITAPHIHPGFVGPITLELFNHGEWELEFSAGLDAVCQIVFWEVKTPPQPKAIRTENTVSYEDEAAVNFSYGDRLRHWVERTRQSLPQFGIPSIAAPFSVFAAPCLDAASSAWPVPCSMSLIWIILNLGERSFGLEFYRKMKQTGTRESPGCDGSAGGDTRVLGALAGSPGFCLSPRESFTKHSTSSVT